jgi:hypothetical protein
VERSEQEIARPVAGEHTSGPIRPMGSGGQSHHQDRGFVIADTVHRPGPILLVGERSPLLSTDPLPPLDQPWTEPALDDLPFDIA